MAEQTAIEWCDATFNPWIGCTKVSPGGCANCYAEVSTPARVKRAAGIETWGPRGQRQRTSTHNWRQPLVWNAATFVKCASCDWRGDLRDFESDDGWTMCPAAAATIRRTGCDSPLPTARLTIRDRWPARRESNPRPRA